MNAKRVRILFAALTGLLLSTAFQSDPVRDESQPLAPMWLNQSPTVAWWAPEIYAWARAYDLNPNVIATLMQLESCGRPEAESMSLAQGLFQVMPFNFPDEYQGRMQDPEINAEIGIQYFNYVLEKSGDSLLMAFAAYNGGPSRLSQPIGLWPDETQRYYYWARISIDALQNAERSDRLNEWLVSDGGHLCGTAATWQAVHQRDATIQPATHEPGVITLDFPPIVWVVLLIVGALAVRRWVSETWGNLGIDAIVTIVIILWFPINIFGQKAEYENVVFWARAWFDDNEPVDQTLEFIQKGEDLGLPIPESVKNAKSKYESMKDFTLNVSLWVSRDPVLTPLASWISQLVFDGIKDLPNIQAYAALSNFTAPFDRPVLVRAVMDGRGVTNPWGVHGNFCFSCLGLQSWLGTDVKMEPDQYFYSTIEGVVDRVIVDGGSAVGGSSVWIVGETSRVAVLHVLTEDTKQWQKGQIVSKGQKIGRQDPADGHIHVVMELQNPDGSWGDYPLVFVLDQTGVLFAWYDRTSSYDDLYVPSVEDLTGRSRRLSNER